MSIDGRVVIWRINEGPDEDDKPQISGKVVLAIQIVGAGKSVHPRLCWHPHKQVSCSLQFISFHMSLYCIAGYGFSCFVIACISYII